MPEISWTELIKLNNDLVRVEAEMKALSDDVSAMVRDIREIKEENREAKLLFSRGTDKMETIVADIRELKEEQQDTKILFARGKGAVYVLMVLGVVVGSMLGFGRDIFLKLWRP